MMYVSLLIQELRARLRSDEGASAVEYGLLVSLIAAAIVALVAGLGTRVGAIFTSVTNSF